MSSIEQRVFSAVRSIVDDRAYPYEAPADTPTPYVTYDLVTGAGSYTLSSVVNSDRCLVQIDLWGSADEPLSEFVELALQVRRALETAGGRLQSEGRERDPAGLWRARMDFVFWHRPA